MIREYGLAATVSVGKTQVLQSHLKVRIHAEELVMIIAKRTRYYALSLLVLANAVDVLASRHAFNMGITELNPLMATLLSYGGLVAIVWFKGICLVLLLIFIPYMEAVWTQVLFLAACVCYVGVVVYHIIYMNSFGWF